MRRGIFGRTISGKIITRRIFAGLLAAVLTFSSLNLDVMADTLDYVADETDANGYGLNGEAFDTLKSDVSGDAIYFDDENPREVSDNDYLPESEDAWQTDIPDVSSDETFESDTFESNTEQFEYAGGYIPSKDDNNAPAYFPDGSPFEAFNFDSGQTIPEKYNNTFDIVNKLYPATRNQNPYGTCWAHGAIFCAEADLIYQKKATKSIDFSEAAMVYYATHTAVDPMGGTKGDDIIQSWDILEHGYNTIGAFYALSQWLGPINEKKAPYDSKVEALMRKGVSTDLAYSNSEAYVTGMRKINIHENPEGVKAAIMANGAVAVSFYADDIYYSSTNNCYYCNDGYYLTNHAVAIVGWDDSFSKSKFNKTPSANGAWLIRNSWTTTNGMSYFSYFWMSYKDKSLDDTAYAFMMDGDKLYDNNYQYDGSRESIQSNYKTSANVFTVKGRNGSETESLKAVSFLLSADAGVSYTIKIYRNVQSTPDTGELVSGATTTGRTDYAGYYTVDLKNPVILNRGEKFAVVVTTDSANGVDREYGDTVTELGPGEDWIGRAKMASKTSYYYDGSKWEECSTFPYNGYDTYGNLRIKAFTTDNAPVPDGQYRIVFSGNGNTGGDTEPITTGVYDNVSFTNGFTKTGYVFNEWNTKSDGKGTSYKLGESYSNIGKSGNIVYLYAQWTPITYTIKFNANGGTGSANDIVATYDMEYELPNETDGFRKEGKILGGWNTKADGSGENYYLSKKVKNLATEQGATAVLYAKWKDIFEIESGVLKKYNGQEAIVTIPSNVSRIASDAFAYNLYIKTVIIKDNVTTIDDSAFAGITTLTIVGKPGTVAETLAKNNKFKFVDIATVLNYSVYFNLNGGSGAVDSMTGLISLAGNITLPKTNSEKTGYSLAGWCRDMYGNGTVYAPGKSIPCPAAYDNETVTFYAIWKANKYKVSLNVNGGSKLSTTSKTVAYESTYGSLPTPTRKGYTFWGWYTDKEGGTRVDENTVMTHLEAHTLYAHWYSSICNVTFDACGGHIASGYPGFITVYGGNKYAYQAKENGVAEYTLLPTVTPDAVTQEGMSFIGWFTSPEGGSQVTEDTKVTAACDHTLYAHYEITKYRVSFELSGGTMGEGKDDYALVEYKKTLTKPADPLKADYRFVKWATNPEGTNEYDFNTELTENKTLYAVWAKKYTCADVTFSLNEYSLYLSTETNGADIYYTTDGTTPTDNSSKYEDAIILDDLHFAPGRKVTVKAIAYRENYYPSACAEHSYDIPNTVDGWGDAETDGKAAGYTNPSQIPEGLWVSGLPESTTYTGKAITFNDIRVYDKKTKLTPDTDYKISYKNNTNAGTATITITGKGNFTGTLAREVKITPVEMYKAFSIKVPNVAYQNKKNTCFSNPAVIGLDMNVLTKGNDYTVSYAYTTAATVYVGTKSVSRQAGDEVETTDIVPAGTQITATITGKGNYKASVSMNYFVVDSPVGNLSKATVTVPKYTYTGRPVEIAPEELKVTINKKQLTPGADYMVASKYSFNTDAGTAYTYIESQGDLYTGSKQVKFTISPKKLSDEDVNAELSSAYLTYDKAGVKPSVTLTYNGMVLAEGKDYTLSYSNVTAAALDTAKKAPTVTIKGKGNYAGQRKIKYTISPKDIADSSVSINVPDVVWADKKGAYKSTPVLTDGTAKLSSKDYSAVYKYIDETIVLSGKNELIRAAGETVAAGDIVPAGTRISCEVTGKGNYSGFRPSVEYEILEKVSLTDGSVKFKDKSYNIWNDVDEEYVFAKGGVKPEVLVYYKDELLTQGVDYSIKHSNNTAVKAYDAASKQPAIVITGKGRFNGTVTLKYSITEQNIGLLALTASDKTYNKSPNKYKSTPVITDLDGKKLVSGKDFSNIKYYYGADVTLANGTVRSEGMEVGSKDVVPAGTLIRVSVTGIKNYKGTLTSTGTHTPYTYKIVKGSISSAKVTIPSQAYTGRAVTPGKNKMTVKVGSAALESSDYDIIGYENNIKKGTAKVTLKGKGNYSGSKTVSFAITGKTMYYTIMFDGNGADSGSVKSITVASGKAVKLPAFGFKRKNMVSRADCWNTKPDGTGTRYPAASSVTNDGHDGEIIVLYAQWENVGTVNSVSVSPSKDYKNACTQQVISWTASGRTDSFIVYRATSPEGKYTKAATSKTKSATVKNLSDGTKYYYKVAAVADDKVSGKKYSVTGEKSTVYGLGTTRFKPSLSGKLTIKPTSDPTNFSFETNLTNKSGCPIEMDNYYHGDCNVNKTEPYYKWTITGTTLYESGTLPDVYGKTTVAKGQSLKTQWKMLPGCWNCTWSTSFAGLANSLTGDIPFKFTCDGVVYIARVDTSGKISYTPVGFDE